MELIDVTRTLTGKINPVGETHTDNNRYENLLEAMELIEALLADISHVSINKDRSEYSMSRAGKCASEFLFNVGRRYGSQSE